MKQLNRIKIVLVEQNKTAKWLSDQIREECLFGISLVYKFVSA